MLPARARRRLASPEQRSTRASADLLQVQETRCATRKIPVPDPVSKIAQHHRTSQNAAVRLRCSAPKSRRRAPPRLARQRLFPTRRLMLIAQRSLLPQHRGGGPPARRLGMSASTRRPCRRAEVRRDYTPPQN